jgi:GrpB-like predicted nucleotidyltransferase (UPF0157 family)
MVVVVVPWDPAWSVAFERVASELRGALADVPGAEVEHVGSTSVPGLAAKPVLDVDVIVPVSEVPAGDRGAGAGRVPAPRRPRRPPPRGVPLTG